MIKQRVVGIVAGMILLGAQGFWGSGFCHDPAYAPASAMTKALPDALTAAPRYPDIGLSSPASRTVQKCLGINALAAWAGRLFLEKELKEKLNGEVAVDIQPFSGFDLLSGKAHQVKIQGSHVVYNKFIPFTELSMETDPSTPLFMHIQKKPAFLRPVHAKVYAVITESDLNRIFQTKRGLKRLSHIRLKLPPIGEQYVDFLSPKVRIEQDRLVFEALLNISGTPAENAVPISAKGKLVSDAETGNLRLSNLEIRADGVSDLQPLAGFVESYFGEVVKISRLKVKHHQVQVQLAQPVLEDRRMVLQGVVTVAPVPMAPAKPKEMSSLFPLERSKNF